MDLTYLDVMDEINTLLNTSRLDEDKLKTIHRNIEVYNAYKVIANQDDKLMKDVQFLLNSAITLIKYNNLKDWKFQLKAAVTLLHKELET